VSAKQPGGADDPNAEAGITTRTVELVVALTLFALGALVAFKSWELGAGWRDDGPGAGYFPFYIALAICISSAVVAVRAFGAGDDGAVFVSHAQLKLVMTVLWPTLAFVIAVQLIGLYIGSVLFIAGFMVWVGHYHWAKSIGIALAVMVIAFLMFEVWFKVPLFKGSFNLLSFLGY
jgi:Tripartite tricarboxylate transporter TctB family